MVSIATDGESLHKSDLSRLASIESPVNTVISAVRLANVSPSQNR